LACFVVLREIRSVSGLLLLFFVAFLSQFQVAAAAAFIFTISYRYIEFVFVRKEMILLFCSASSSSYSSASFLSLFPVFSLSLMF